MFEIKAEDNYCRDIIFAIRKLEQVAPSTTEEKVDAIRRIGNVSWTGGPPALRRAGAQIPRFVNGSFPGTKIKISNVIIWGSTGSSGVG